MLRKTCGEYSLQKTTVYQWFDSFQDSGKSANDNEYSSRHLFTAHTDEEEINLVAALPYQRNINQLLSCRRDARYIKTIANRRILMEDLQKKWSARTLFLVTRCENNE